MLWIIYLGILLSQSITVIIAIKEAYETQVLTLYSRIRPLNADDDLYTTNDKEENNSETALDWPIGTYGLLQTIYGCPNTNLTTWKIGWVFQNTENDQNENNCSSSLHAKINVTKFGITQNFCIKDNKNGTRHWPKGNFCIYQYGEACPKNFRSGYVYWDDENNNNKNANDGFLPRGNYGQDTEIRFCCRTDGDLDKQIELPIQNPFCLFPINVPKCQKVKNMNHILEYVKFDDEDESNRDTQGGSYPYGIQPSKRDHYLYYCYYFKKSDITEDINIDEEESGFSISSLENSKNLKLMSSMEKQNFGLPHFKKWMTVFGAVAFVTMLFGFTAFMVLRSVAAVGFNQLKQLKIKKKLPNNIYDIKQKYEEKYKHLQNSSLNKQQKDTTFIKVWETEDVQELTEDYLVPQNSELQHSLALLFMKNQKH